MINIKNSQTPAKTKMQSRNQNPITKKQKSQTEEHTKD